MYRAVSFNAVATSHMWQLKVNLTKIKYNKKFSSSDTLATFQVLNSPMWPAITVSETELWMAPILAKNPTGETR